MLLAVLAAVGFAMLVTRAWREQEPRPANPGMVRQTEIRIAPEVTGRLAAVAVNPGQHVRKVIFSPCSIIRT
ncbi:hypothetical protein ACVDG8_037990 (plasmid) [Mesorhizobium sp. ORM8.1]